MAQIFASIIKAARQFEAGNWTLADELLKHADGFKAGERGLDAVAAALAQEGLDYTSTWLQALRRTAELFPPERRHSGVGIMLHTEAGSPDMLDAIMKIAKREDKSLSLHSIRRIMAQLKREELAEREEEAKAAEEEAKQAAKEEAEAKNDAARTRARSKKKAAKKRAQTARGAPKRAKATKPPKEEDASFLLVRTQFMADLGQIGKLVKKMNKTLAPAIEAEQLTPAFCNAAMEECLAWAHELRALSDLIKKNRPKGASRGILYAV